ncbi:MAG: PilZ domain-containing protein [Myxococcota bacterium]|nr:PilZ domain-containing protein [Myxococcota bacterium]
MKDEFDKMIANLERTVDELCHELNLDVTIEGLYSLGSLHGKNVADTLDSAVRHLLEAGSPGLHCVLQAKKVSAATDLVRGVLEQFKAEQSTDGETDVASSRVSRRGAKVFVKIDHISETNFFTDLSSEISRGGLFVATYDVLSAGTSLSVFLSLPCGRSFPLKGSVSWVREFENCAGGASPGMGITFQRLSAELTAAVNRYMAKRPPLLFEMA